MDAEPVNLEMDEIPTKTLVIDRTVARNTPLPYDGEFDDNTQILTDKTSNISSETSFITPTRPRLETTEPFTDRGKLLAGASLLGQKMDYTIIGDKLRDALKGSDWEPTNSGINKLAPRIEPEGDKIYYVPESWEIKDMTDKQIENLDKKINPDGKIFSYRILLTKDDTFFADGTLKGKYGKTIIDRIKKVLNMPEEDEDDTDGRVGRFFKRFEQAKGFSGDRLQKEAEDIAQEFGEHGFEYQDSRRETPNIDIIINDSSTQTPEQVINKLIGAPEEELKASGFTDNALREWRGLIKASDSISSVKAFKDVMLKEIDNELKELHEQFLREDDTDKNSRRRKPSQRRSA